jgi:hypothetical protein
MSVLIAVPEMVAAATDLARVGSTLSAANAAAVAPTSSVIAAGADEVSASIAALFGAHAQAYQTLSAQAAPPPICAGPHRGRQLVRRRRGSERLAVAGRAARRGARGQWTQPGADGASADR